MDDHDLGALLDASVPTAPASACASASEDALTRIHRRASRRSARARIATVALAAALIATAGATAAALVSTNDSGPPVPPAAPSSTAADAGPSPDSDAAPCPIESITLSIQTLHDGRGATAVTAPPLPSWVVIGATKTRSDCVAKFVIDATIEGSDGKLLARVPGNPAHSTLNTVLIPQGSIGVGSISWTNRCSATPVRIVLRFRDQTNVPAAVLNVPKESCTQPPTGDSHFSLDLDQPGTITMGP